MLQFFGLIKHNQQNLLIMNIMSNVQPELEDSSRSHVLLDAHKMMHLAIH